MSNYQLYQETLTSAGQGTPLWEPMSSPGQHGPSIGDVGYLRFGGFIRLFNAMLPAGHPDNGNGEPLNYEPLTIYSTAVHRSVLPPGVVSASGVQTMGVSQAESDTHIHFKCAAKAGAVVISDSEVHREDVASQSLRLFTDYMAAHVYEWAKFAQFQLKHEVALHELILVTGCDITKGKYSVTVFNSARISRKTDASFQLPHPASEFHTWSHSPAIGYFQHNHGPRHVTRNTEQCLFIRGFRALDRRVERIERQDEAASWHVAKCCTAESQGALDAILRYLTDKSDAEISIAHDYDLARLLQKYNVPCDYRSLLKQLKKCRRPIVKRGNVAFLC